MAERTEEEQTKLKAYLLKAVSVQNDAEPQLLADYLFAFLQNNAKTSLEELSNEISDFVETDAPQLAKNLYSAIQSKSYLNPTAGPSTPASKPLPTGPSSASKKRRLSESGDVEMSDAASGPGHKITRLNDSNQGTGRIGGDAGHDAAFAGRGRRGRGGSNFGPGMQGQPRKQPCFDYHNKGFCARGMQCRYEHGPDTMYAMPNGNMPPMPFPFMMPFPPNGPAQGGPAGPADGSQPGGPPISGDAMQVDASRAGGVKTEEYSPDQPGMGGPSAPFPGMGSPNGAPPFPFPPGGPPPPGMMPFMMGMPGMPGMFPPPFDQGGMRGNGRGRGGSRGGRGGRAGGEGFNDWDGDLSNRPPNDNRSSTLVVAEIPTASLNLEAIHNQFKQFGTVTNVAVEARAKKALVAFANNREAHAAWSSKESFFGDRHVKVLWHRPRDGQGGAGQKALTDSAPLLENLRKIDQEGVDAFQAAARPDLPKVDPEIKAQLAQVKERGLQLEKIVAEQKVLMKRLEGAKDAEEKTQLKTRLKELIGESTAIKQANAGIDVEKLQAIIEAQQKARDEAQAKAREAAKARRSAHNMNDLLDLEMEEHNIQAQLEGSKDIKDEDVDEETLKLRAQLAALKNQASSLGINPDASTFTPRGSYRGGRGRGMGGGGRGGAGAGPMRSLKLDNRPKSLVITSPAVQSDREETLKHVTEWYAVLADNMVREPMVVDDKVVVAFSNRGSAETAMAMGTTIPNISSPVTIGWHAAPVPAAEAPSTSVKMEGVEATQVKEEPVIKEEPMVTRGERDMDE